MIMLLIMKTAQYWKLWRNPWIVDCHQIQHLIKAIYITLSKVRTQVVTAVVIIVSQCFDFLNFFLLFSSVITLLVMLVLKFLVAYISNFSLASDCTVTPQANRLLTWLSNPSNKSRQSFSFISCCLIRHYCQVRSKIPCKIYGNEKILIAL